MAQSDPTGNRTEFSLLSVLNGNPYSIQDMLDKYGFNQKEISSISISHTGYAQNVGHLSVAVGGPGRSVGVAGIASGSRDKNIGVAAESFGNDVWNIGVLSRASDGKINVALEGEAIGKGDQINIGAVTKCETYLSDPGIRYGLLAKAYGNGDGTTDYYNKGVEALVSGTNNINIAVSAQVSDNETHDGRSVVCAESDNYAFRGFVNAPKSKNYGIYQEVSGAGSENIALYCASSGGTLNLAARFGGNIEVTDQKGGSTIFMDAAKGTIISSQSMSFVPGKTVSTNKHITGASEKIGQLLGLVYSSTAETDEIRYGLDWNLLNKVFPELTAESPEYGPMVNYDGLIPVMVTALNELASVVRNQQKEIEALKAGSGTK